MHQLEIKQEFKVSVATLFEAWSKAEVMQKWFAPGDMSIPEASVDFVEGGSYRIVMEEKNSEQHIIGGRYLTIIPNKQISFSWQWDGNPHSTRVDISFIAISDSTASLVLVHSEFEDQESCDKHQMGWHGCLTNLQNKAF